MNDFPTGLGILVAGAAMGVIIAGGLIVAAAVLAMFFG